MDSKEDKKTLNKMKRSIVIAAANAGEGHIASAFSILDILWVLYDQVLNLHSIQSKNLDRDRFVLSKGHACLGLYAVLAKKGFFSLLELENTFCKFSSIFGGHPNCNKVPGVEASTGSLGHGLPFALGIALGYKIKSIPQRVFTLIGDGECNEGTIWESVLLAAHHNLNNLCCIIDYNHSTDRALLLNDIARKFESFDWATIIINGHDHKEILNALQKTDSQKPTAIIANTIKGFGCSRMENDPAWHHRVPTKEELIEVLIELG
jgi:transketolase